MPRALAAAVRPFRLFYGWWIVLAAAVGFGLSGGLYMYGFSTLLLPLEAEFGWSRAALSGVFSVSRLEGGLLGPMGGWLADRFGPRKVMLGGVFLSGVGFILLSQVTSLLMFYLIFLVAISLGWTLGIHTAAMVAIANWFHRKRGRAIGVALSGMGLGGVIVPGLAWIIVHHGWRLALVASGLAILVICLPLSLVMRHRPEQYGQLPDGDTAPPSGQVKEEAKGARPAPAAVPQVTSVSDATVGEVIRLPVFWLLCLVFGLRQLTIASVVVHQVPFLVSIGLPQEVGASVLGAVAVLSVLGRLGFGWLGDLIPKRYAMAAALFLLALGSFILANATQLWQVLLFLATYPLGYGGGATLMFAIRGEYFGRTHFGTISGLMDMFQMIAVVAGPVFAGWMFDISGSYRVAFLLFATAAFLGLLIMLFLRRPERSQPCAVPSGTSIS